MKYHVGGLQRVVRVCHFIFCSCVNMAGETGGTGSDLPPPGPSNFISWVEPGLDPIYNENGPFLLLLDCFSATAIVV